MTRVFFLFLIFLISCGSGKEDKVDSAIDLALTHLSSDRCDQALETLKDDEDLKNPVYLQVLASAYACKAGVNSIEVISELKKVSSIDVLNDISKKSFAQGDFTAYQSLGKSLDIILSSTNVVSQAQREVTFGKRKGQDLGMQALLYSVVHISKFVHYFGNAKDGDKGKGDLPNGCFLDYSDNPVYFPLILAQTYNGCSIINDGHPELLLSTIEGKKLACDGIVLINNTLDILETIEFGDSQDLKVLKEVSERISTLRDAILSIQPDLARLFQLRDSKSCIELDESDIQIFLFAVYELGFK